MSAYKGFGEPPVSLPLELKTNRINMIFAPNGSGKSSLAAAFRSLEGRSLKVEKENKYHKDESLQSSLSFDLDGNHFMADATTNTITSNIICHVINCATTVHTTQRNMGRFTTVSGYIDIQDIVVEPEIAPSSTGYTISKIKSEFGINAKILKNNQHIFESHDFLLRTKEIWMQIDSFGRAKSRKRMIDSIMSEIQTLRGKTEEVLSQIDLSWFAEIESDNTYLEISAILDDIFQGENSIERFLNFFQLYTHWNQNKHSIKKATARAEYEKRRCIYEQEIALLDTTWKDIHIEETGGNLMVKFPQSDEISNGQRDLLTFIVNVLKFKTQIRQDKKYLLLIDEVFDYLDDANLITAQYYLTNFLNLSKDNIFLCLLSHLNPYSFRSYVFSDKKLNIQYLKQTIPVATHKMKDFISFRERIGTEGKQGDGPKLTLYKNLSHDLFHYNPNAADYSLDIENNKKPQEDRQIIQLGNRTNLHQFIIGEVNKYLSGQPQYDPYAVAMALRIRVEKLAYSQLPDDLHQGFVDTPMTRNKFDYCIDNGFNVPDIYYIVSAIHNEADHLKFDEVANRYIEKPMVYKLQNNAITIILKKIFDWQGVNLSTDVID